MELTEKATAADAIEVRTEAEAPTSIDFTATTGLRGVCAVAVVVIVGNFFLGFADTPEHVSLDYHTCVSIFFVVSGVLIASLYGSKLTATGCCWVAHPNNLRFYKTRAARIVPLYYLTLSPMTRKEVDAAPRGGVFTQF